MLVAHSTSSASPSTPHSTSPSSNRSAAGARPAKPRLNIKQSNLNQKNEYKKMTTLYLRKSIGRSPWALVVGLATLGLGLSATADAPRRTFITSTSQAPPQVRYMVIELGGRRANDISGSGQIVGNEQFPSGI